MAAADAYLVNDQPEGEYSPQLSPTFNSSGLIGDSDGESETWTPTTAEKTFPKKVNGLLDAGPEFNAAVSVRMDGMEFPNENTSNVLSLDNFDENQPYRPGAVLLNSPRSVMACLRLGMTPHEIVKVPFVVSDGVDPQIASMRYLHAERRRKQKIKALMEERNSLIGTESEFIKTSSSKRLVASLVKNEEAYLARIVAANQSQLRQQIMHDEKMREKYQEKEAKLEAQRQKDAAEKERKRQERKERERIQEEKSKERQLERERDAEAHTEMLHAKQQEYVQQDLKRAQLMAERAQRLEIRAKIMSQKANQRKAAIKAMSESMLQEKLSFYEMKQKKADQSRKDFEEYQEELRRQQKEKAALKEQKIKEALGRSADIEKYKIALALAKQEKATEAKRRFDEDRQKTLENRKKVEADKEYRRQEIYHQANLRSLQKIQHIGKMRRQLEARLEQTRQTREIERGLKKEALKLKAADKQENVDRMKNVVEYLKYRTLVQIQNKIEKSDFVKDQREVLRVRRKNQREEIDRLKIQIPTITPGPGDYLGPENILAKRGPAWKFGASRDVMPNVEPGRGLSPGPAAYEVEIAKLKRKHGTAVFAKSPRFQSVVTTPEDSVRPGLGRSHAPETLTQD